MNNTIKSNRVKAVLAAAVVAGGLATSAQASIVQNGSFETGVTGNIAGLNNGAMFSDLNTTGPSWDRWRHIDGWSTVVGAGIEIQSNRTLSTIDAHSGNHYVELDSNNNSHMAQDVFLSVGSYVLSFWYSPRTNDPATNGIEYALGMLAGGKVKNGVPVGATVGNWVEITNTFMVHQAGTYNLKFAAVGTNDTLGGLLDDIAIAPVPLPAAGFGLMAALGGLAALRRRRRKA
ncbi:MAG: hypothetical protein WBC68_01085 [Albidovulum sp.]